MIDYLKSILTGQYEAALCVLKDCIRKCPEEHWESKIANNSFRQIAYHTLFWMDCDLTPDERAFQLRKCHQCGGDERTSDEPCVGLSKAETLDYVSVCRQKLLQTMAAETAESLQGRSAFSRHAFSRAESYLYNTRDIQHHTGQLSAYLRRIPVEDGERW